MPDRRRIEQCLAAFPPPRRWPTHAAEGLRAAAVLIPLVERSRGLQVVLTRRAAHLREHAGQIGFPGGRLESGDASATAAALRETHEEIGVPASSVEVLGVLPEYRTGTGFAVAPVVGFLPERTAFRRDPAEVAEVFEVPLAFLLNPRHHRRHTIVHAGRRYRLWAMPYRHYFIWGATAGMLRLLYERVEQPHRPGADAGERGP